MGKVFDLIGKRFGRLVVIDRAENAKNGSTRWVCRCDCGNIKTVQRSNLMSGDIKSCGCLRKEVTSKLNKKHGQAGTRLHHIWIGMKQRCSNPKHKSYADYGGRGIKVCAEWEDFKNFYGWAINNGYQDGLEIDRIDNNEDYRPDNCRWVTRKVNSRNRRSNALFRYKGKTMTMIELAEIAGISKRAMQHRIKRGWSIKRAVETPLTTKVKGV